MAYSRTLWVNDAAPAIDAAHLNNIEEGLVTVDTLANSLLSTKQNVLVSGTTLKTVNGTSLLGSGDITIDQGGEYDAAHTFNFTGTQEFSNGLKFKWGTVEAPTGSTSVTFDTPFTTACFQVMLSATSIGDTAGIDFMHALSAPPSKTGFTVSSNTSVPINYFAIGV